MMYTNVMETIKSASNSRSYSKLQTTDALVRYTKRSINGDVITTGDDITTAPIHLSFTVPEKPLTAIKPERQSLLPPPPVLPSRREALLNILSV